MKPLLLILLFSLAGTLASTFAQTGKSTTSPINNKLTSQTDGVTGLQQDAPAAGVEDDSTCLLICLPH